MKNLINTSKDNLDMKRAFVKSVSEVFATYKETKIILGDIGHFGFRHIWEDIKNKDRYFNVGILEQSMVGFAAGIAKSGAYPIIHTITPFLVERPFEQIKIDFGLNKLKGCFISVGGAFDYSTLGPTHHSYSDLAFFSTINDSEVFSVSSYLELREAIFNSVQNKKLSYIRMNRNIHSLDLMEPIKKGLTSIKIANGHILTIVVTGGRVSDAIKAVKLLEKEGISADIFYVYQIKPLQIDQIQKSIDLTNNLVVIEDHSSVGSLYSNLLMLLNLKNLISKRGLNLSDHYIRGYGNYDDLSERENLDSIKIFNTIKDLLNK